MKATAPPTPEREKGGLRASLSRKMQFVAWSEPLTTTAPPEPCTSPRASVRFSSSISSDESAVRTRPANSASSTVAEAVPIPRIRRCFSPASKVPRYVPGERRTSVVTFDASLARSIAAVSVGATCGTAMTCPSSTTATVVAPSGRQAQRPFESLRSTASLDAELDGSPVSQNRKVAEDPSDHAKVPSLAASLSPIQSLALRGTAKVVRTHSFSAASSIVARSPPSERAKSRIAAEFAGAVFRTAR